MNCVLGKIKWFIIATLVILVAGMTVFGIFGFNNTADHSNSYEVEISVDQNIDKAKEILKSSSEKYLSEKGLTYSVQVMDGGAMLTYKFGADVSEKVADMASYVDTALAADAESNGVKVEVNVRAVKGDATINVCKLLVAVGVSILAIFLFVLIMERMLASAVAVVCSAVLAFLIFVSLMALTRLPANPFADAVSVIAMVISAILSVVTVNKYREEIKNATTKITNAEIARKVAKAEYKKYVFAFACVFVASIALVALFTEYLLIAGAQILLAGVASFVSLFVTPLVWVAIRNSKKK